ncbi:hypothetical protein GOV13_02730 [Candidatus Pacearchaeota archaeon]|nr:hypothetical protein [Candidatus Pacearchaeota archaeon]
MSTGSCRLVKIEVKVTEVHKVPHKKTPVVVREFVTVDSSGKPCFFQTHRAVRDLLFKIIEWDYMNAPTMFWTIAHHDKFTDELFNFETLTFDPAKLNGKK